MGNFQKNLTTKYLFVLILLGTILCASYLIFASYIGSLYLDDNLINLSGRQRMLSQRIYLLTSLLHQTSNQNQIQEIQTKLNLAIKTMEDSHLKLLREVEPIPDLKRIYFGEPHNLDRQVKDFIALAKENSSVAEKPPNNFISISQLDILFLGLDQAVSAFENENRRHDAVLQNIQLSVVIIGLIALILSGLFVFKPMTLEITEKTNKLKEEHQHVTLLLEIAIIANEAKSVDEAIKRTLHNICINAHWAVGHAYVIDENDKEILKSSNLWYLENSSRFYIFKELTEKMTFTANVGLPGRVLAGREPIWVDDVTKDQNFPRNKVVSEIGVRSAFGLPIFSNGELVAVLEFFSDKIITKDNSLLNVIAHVGCQLGHVYDRVLAEQRITLLNHTLEDRIVERTKELKAKNEELALQQQAIVTASKMSALGEMASGIAHEINNPLAIIQVRAEQLKEIAETEEIDKIIVLDVVDEIIKTATRIATIIKGLRSFARDGRNDPFQSAVLKNIVDETIDLCREKFKHNNIRLDIKPISINMEIECRATQLSQVILNLLNNAYDAIQHLEDKWVCVSVSDLGHQIEINISDSGNGIPKELQDKIMQPFFTTKEIGKGTGLGLSISRGIILSHRGQLIIENTSKNTHFVIRLPKSQSKYERKVS